MTKRRGSPLQAGVVLVMLAASAGLAAAGQSAPGETAATPERELLDRYCVACHNERLQTACRPRDWSSTART